MKWLFCSCELSRITLFIFCILYYTNNYSFACHILIKYNISKNKDNRSIYFRCNVNVKILSFDFIQIL
ncbi:hypothetical protein PFMALIP_02729 [Plasmodium falciparum MaliPS096_E11]|uniref:Uncharacterized protein n=1 Tax=Plasmodium falciparum MaliPS096_E11 TaxID=1036727 RepID=A0A024WRR3_PLAFA|nr:hypothetical protein PFMALIP_02729 [Plasmodium falciparum MaliPS096_E11]